jgi:hypothetical protein
MTEQSPHQESAKERVEALYPEYMEMIRTFVGEGILEVEEPTELQKAWAQKASLGNPELAVTFGYLAQLTEQAHKQRYLEGMPMLVDTKDASNEPFVDLQPVERFHFLRMVARDQKALTDTPAEPEMANVPKVLYITPAEDDSFEQELAEVIEQDNHLPAVQPIACLGEVCTRFSGVACDAYEEWISAKGPAEGRDTSKPPLREEAVTITYGQVCGNDDDKDLLSVRVDVYKPEEVNPMEMIATSDRYGVPSSVRVVAADQTFGIETIASSED